MALSDHLFVQAMIQEGSGQAVPVHISSCPDKAGGGWGVVSGKKILHFFSLMNMKAPTCVSSCVSVQPAWVDRDFSVWEQLY